VWHHASLKNWVNCAVLKGNSAGLRTVLSSRLSHRELLGSIRESHSLLSLTADTQLSTKNQRQVTITFTEAYRSFFVSIHHSHTHKKTHRNEKKNPPKTNKPDGKRVLCQRTFSSVFRAVFFTQLNCTIWLRVYGTLYMIRLYGEEMLAPRPNPKLEDHPLSVIPDCLFTIFAATLHIEGRSSIRKLRTF
jgi:hypothetical protein